MRGHQYAYAGAKVRLFGIRRARLFNQRQQADENRAAAHQQNARGKRGHDGQAEYMEGIENERVGARHQTLIRIEQRHYLRASLPQQRGHRHQLESRCAQLVDDLRQCCHCVGAISAAVVQQHDVAFLRLRLFNYSRNDLLRRRHATARLAAPVVRIDARSDDDVTQRLRDGQQRHFIRGLGLVIDAVRRTKKNGLDAQQASKKPLGQIQLKLDLQSRNVREVRMGVRVIGNLMALVVDAPQQRRRIAGRQPNYEKCCRHIFGAEDVQNFRGEAGIRAVVEGQGNLSGHRAKLFDLPGQRKFHIGLVVNGVSRGVVLNFAASGFGLRAHVPDISVAFEDNVEARRKNR